MSGVPNLFFGICSEGHYDRFVDRDMFMRFFGGSIGHKATNKYTAALREDALAMVNAQSTSAASAIVEDEVQVVDELESEEARLAEKSDYGYELGSDAEDEDYVSDDNDANLGAEDGEEPWEMDDLHAEGYDEL